MTKEHAERYVKELIVATQVEVYESNGQKIFPIHLKTPEGAMALENAYMYYLTDGHFKYGVSIFINDDMTYGAFYRIFHTAITNFKLELMKANTQHEKNAVE